MFALFLCNCILCYKHLRTDMWVGEASTAVESEGVVRRRRTLVTRRVVTLAGGSSIVFLRPHRVRIGVASNWRMHSMRVYFVSIEYYCSITPRLLHVPISCSRVLDQHSGDPSFALTQATGHQLVSLCRSVAEEEKSQLMGPLMTS